MTAESWIVVPNWDKFQHYADRNPPWVKLYTELNRRDDWRSLTYSDRGLMTSIWAEYGVANGLLRVSDLSYRLGQRVDSRALTSLNHAGFIAIVASKPLAPSRALAREEKRREEHPRASAKKPKPKQPAETRTNAAAYQPFNNAAPEVIEVDQATLDLARKWLRPQ